MDALDDGSLLLAQACLPPAAEIESDQAALEEPAGHLQGMLENRLVRDRP